MKKKNAILIAVAVVVIGGLVAYQRMNKKEAVEVDTTTAIEASAEEHTVVPVPVVEETPVVVLVPVVEETPAVE